MLSQTFLFLCLYFFSGSLIFLFVFKIPNDFYNFMYFCNELMNEGISINYPLSPLYFVKTLFDLRDTKTVVKKGINTFFSKIKLSYVSFINIKKNNLNNKLFSIVKKSSCAFSSLFNPTKSPSYYF